jgi:prepilin-type N-terminal cleavage/methylation domain-containing protein
MKLARRGFFSKHLSASDAGLTLIEVLAAVIVIVIVALAAAGLSINGIQTATAQERQQVAVTIANGAMENVSGWSVVTNTSTGISNLYTGRCQSDVNTSFTNNSTIPGVSATYPVWDTVATAAATCSAPAIPATKSPTGTGAFLLAPENGTKYTLTTIIGACYEPVAGGSCAKITGQPSNPTTTPAGYTPLIRVIVVVSWPATGAGGNRCAVSGCYYETTTLVDAHTELNWVGSL